jgi:hypothetical protein
MMENLLSPVYGSCEESCFLKMVNMAKKEGLKAIKIESIN